MLRIRARQRKTNTIGALRGICSANVWYTCIAISEQATGSRERICPRPQYAHNLERILRVDADAVTHAFLLLSAYANSKRTFLFGCSAVMVLACGRDGMDPAASQTRQ